MDKGKFILYRGGGVKMSKGVGEAEILFVLEVRSWGRT